MLVEGGASLDIADSDGRTPLSWAIYLGRPKIGGYPPPSPPSGMHLGRVAWILAIAIAIAVLTPSLPPSLHQPHPTVVSLLLKAGANLDTVDADGKTFLHLMTRNSNTKCFAAVAKHTPLEGLTVDTLDRLGMTALHWAA